MGFFSETVPSPGFLKEFHFSTVLDDVFRRLLGEVGRPTWLSVELQNIQNVHDFGTSFVLLIVSAEHVVRPASGAADEFVPRKTVSVELKVSGYEIQQKGRDLPRHVLEWAEHTLLDSAFHFYELDPRIGWQYNPEDPDARLPVSPFFDPIEEFSRTGFPEGGLESVCAICGEPHTIEEAPVWAGTNLMWVHARCWESFS